MRKRGVGDKSLSINMPQLFFQRAESAPPLGPPITNESSSSIWWAVLGGRGTSAWGGGNFCLGGGGKSQVSHPPV